MSKTVINSKSLGREIDQKLQEATKTFVKIYEAGIEVSPTTTCHMEVERDGKKYIISIKAV